MARVKRHATLEVAGVKRDMGDSRLHADSLTRRDALQKSARGVACHGQPEKGDSMNLNADFTARAAVHDADNPWADSPMPGVQRKKLDRIGAEKARATSIVRYAPGSHFAAHSHPGGEEFLVLDGVFQDEHGDYPAGTYVRNPPGTAHTPGAAEGCTILVKLWQFDPADAIQMARDTATGTFAEAPQCPGVAVQRLYHDAREDVRLETWAPGTRIADTWAGGGEIFVLDGGFEEGGETFAPWDWLRLPPGARLDAVAGPEGARVWIKSGHLADMPGNDGPGNDGPGRDVPGRGV